ncbi:MAG: site-2 protease family protein [Firmicutes bacterium]|nr:site-2 protease family protein [Candidatus Alectryobacillus merdavium]
MVLNWIITIILFIVGLCLLVSLHELGHYITAKIFGVYCFEYSIGFGKKIIRRKSKFAETFFCIGVLPFGGYVSMYGEDDEEEAGDSKKEKRNQNVELNDIVFSEDNDSKSEQKDATKKEENLNEEHYEFDIINQINKKTYKLQQKLLKKFNGDKQKVVDYLIKKYCDKKKLDFSKTYFEQVESEELINEYFDKFISIKDQYNKEKALTKFNGDKLTSFRYLKREFDKKKPTYKKLRLDLYLNNELTLDDWFIKDSDILSKVDELTLPKYRSLESLSKPKKIIVMSAGIVVNFILGYILYLISYSCFPNDLITARLQVSDSSIQETSFNTNYEKINEDLYQEYYQFLDNDAFSFLSEEQKQGNPFFYTLGTINSSNKVIVAYDIDLHSDFDEDGVNDKYVLVMNNMFTSLENLSLDEQLYTLSNLSNGSQIKNYNLYRYSETSKEEGEFFLPNQEDTYFKLVSDKTYQEELASKNNEGLSIIDPNIEINATFSFWPSVEANNTEAGYYVLNSLKEGATPDDSDIFEENSVNILESQIVIKQSNKEEIFLNTSMYHHSYWEGLNSFKVAGDAWVDGSATVFTVLGNLFVSGDAWNNVGGPLAILTQSAQIIQNYPFSAYIRMWGLISVNLAIFNLIPIPGLDGWQILVAVIEGVSQRKLNAKFKKWASIIGLSLVFGLIIAILVMDVVRLFI